MEIGIEELAEQYSGKEVEQLLDIYFRGALTEEAFACLTKELSSRGVSSYELYLKSDLSQLANRKNQLKADVSELKSAKEKLTSEVMALSTPKRKSMLGLFFERKRLEEEARIDELKHRKNG